MKPLTLATLFSLIVILLFVLAPQAVAQSGGTYDLTWNTIDSGGAMSASGGAYALSGTIGQPDAGASSANAYTLNGGFWSFAASTSSLYIKTYLPVILRNP